jgi:hypothetical protein
MEFTNMNANFTANSGMKIKNTLMGFALTLTCFNPIVALAQYNSEIQQLRQHQADYQLQIDNLTGEMMTYMAQNPLPSVAAIASISGLAAIVEQKIDPGTKAVLLMAGAAGVAYCLDGKNIKYCYEVSTNLIGYGNKLGNYNREINSIERQIRSLQ